MKTLVRETYQIIKLNGRNLLLFEALYRLLTGILYLRLVNAGLKFSLDRAGYTYLTAGNVWDFLLKPWTLAVFVLLAAAGLLLIMIEIGGLLTVYSGAAYSLRLSVLEIGAGALQTVFTQLVRKNFGIFAVGLAHLLLMDSLFLYRILAQIRPVNFLLQEAGQLPWMPAALGAAVCVLLLAVVPTAFVFHSCLIEQKSFRDGRHRSMELLKGRLGKTLFRMAACLAACAAAAAVIYGICVFLAAALTVVFVERDLQLAFLMQTADRIEAAVLILASIAVPVLYFAVLTVQYYQYSSRQAGAAKRWDFFYTRSRLVSGRNGLALLCVAGIAAAFCLFDTAYNGNLITKSVAAQTRITAHRGSSASAPENTMAALQAAVEEMADRAEIDVQESADGALVLCHDETLRRVAGISRKVSELTLEQLRQLDVGSWFSQEFAGEGIPTLEEAMEFAKGRIDLNIEIKNMGDGSSLPERVAEMVEEFEMGEQCVITSTNLNYLRRIKEVSPQIRTGYILSAAYGNYYSDEAVDAVSIRSSFVNRRLLDAVHQEGKTVYAWTVNSRVELERLRMLDVDDIITDDPVYAREILYREEVTETVLEYLRLLFSRR